MRKRILYLSLIIVSGITVANAQDDDKAEQLVSFVMPGEAFAANVMTLDVSTEAASRHGLPIVKVQCHWNTFRRSLYSKRLRGYQLMVVVNDVAIV